MILSSRLLQFQDLGLDLDRRSRKAGLELDVPLDPLYGATVAAVGDKGGIGVLGHLVKVRPQIVVAKGRVPVVIEGHDHFVHAFRLVVVLVVDLRAVA